LTTNCLTDSDKNKDYKTLYKNSIQCKFMNPNYKTHMMPGNEVGIFYSSSATQGF